GPGCAPDGYIQHDRTAGAQTLLAVPAMGWVAKDSNNAAQSTGVPADGGLPNGSFGPDGISGYDPSANQQATSIRSALRKNSPFQDPPDRSDGIVYQDEWLNH